MHKYRYRYAIAGFVFAIIFIILILVLHYLISSGTPAQLLREFPTAAVLISLIIPISFLVGYLWGAEKDQRTSVKILSQRQQEHVEMVDSLSDFLKHGEEARRMSWIAAREMKHPLTSIVGYSLTLCEYWDKLDESSRRNFVDYIKVSASRLEGIANDMLRITELTRFAPRLEKEQLNLAETAEEVKTLLEEIYDERGVKVGLRFPQDLPMISNDPSRLFDLIYNLLDLCMRCSENNGIVSAWGSHSGRNVQLRLRCPNSTIGSDKILSLREWPPPEGNDELATLGMEYRLSQHMLEEMGGSLKLDVMGKNGISFLVSLPLD